MITHRSTSLLATALALPLLSSSALAGDGCQGGSTGNVLSNPSLEDSGANWTQSSTTFGTPLCTTAICGMGGSAGPRTGDWWCWFGGIQAMESGSIGQTVDIPPDATLRFWFEIPVASGNGVDFMNVLVDGNVVFTLLESDGPVLGYQEATVDLTAWEGLGRDLTFESTVTGAVGLTNFFIDDLSLEGSCGTSEPIDLHLNEIYASHAGTDDQEYIELIGTPGGSLDGYLVLVVEGQGGGAGTVDQVWNLAGNAVPDDGFFVLGDTAVANNDFDLGSDNNIENGTETVYLVFADDPAAVEALQGTNATVVAGPGDGTTAIPSVSTVVDVVALVDSDWPDEDTVFDGALAVGPDGDFFPAGIFRYNDYPFDWCTAFFLDFDDEANAAQPRSPGEPNVGDCSLECMLVIGTGPGLTHVQFAGHDFATQVDQVFATYPVLLSDTPLIPLADERFLPGGQHVHDFADPYAAQVFYVQVLMWNPGVFPSDPEQYTQGLQVIVLPGRGIFTRPFGDGTGMTLGAELVRGPDGTPSITFPFTIPGF